MINNLIKQFNCIIFFLLLKLKNNIIPELYYLIIWIGKILIFLKKIFFNTNILLILIIGLNCYYIYMQYMQNRNLNKITTFKIKQITLLEQPDINENLFNRQKQEKIIAMNDVFSRLKNVESMNYFSKYLKDSETRKLFELNGAIVFTSSFKEMIDMLHDLSKHIYQINQFNVTNLDSGDIKTTINFSAGYYEDL